MEIFRKQVLEEQRQHLADLKRFEAELVHHGEALSLSSQHQLRLASLQHEQLQQEHARQQQQVYGVWRVA